LAPVLRLPGKCPVRSQQECSGRVRHRFFGGAVGMMDNLFLLFLATGIFCALFAVGGAIVEGWMWYEDRKKLRGKERI